MRVCSGSRLAANASINWAVRKWGTFRLSPACQLHQQLIDISGKFLAGPKEGVDYQALAAKFPEIRAELDNSRKSVFQAAALVFMSRP